MAGSSTEQWWNPSGKAFERSLYTVNGGGFMNTGSPVFWKKSLVHLSP